MPSKFKQNSVLWLWAAHNQVNQRTKGSDSEDPTHPKKLFPSFKRCKQCYNQHGDFSLSQVLEYLLEGYATVSESVTDFAPRVRRDLLTYAVLLFHALPNVLL